MIVSLATYGSISAFLQLSPKPIGHPRHPILAHGEGLRQRPRVKRLLEMVKSVLIADDHAFVRQRLGELFSREPDFEVCAEAENGKEAVEEAQESYPDLILLDLSMPVMNGLDAARALKRLLREVPIVMFSIYSAPFTEKEARSAGVSALVSQFEDMSQLVAIARNLLNPTTLDHMSAA